MTEKFPRRISAVVLTIAVVSAVLSLPERQALADANPATQGLTSTCLVVADTTPAGLEQAGLQAVVPGERVVFEHRVHLDEGQLFQDAFTRPDGSTYVASYLETIAKASDLSFDSASAALSVDGVNQTLTPSAIPVASGYGLSVDSPIPGVNRFRVYWPGDGAAMVAANLGAGTLSTTIGAGGTDVVFSLAATVPDAPSVVAGAVEPGVQCFASVSTGPSNRDTDRVDVDVAVVEPQIRMTKLLVGDAVMNAGGTVSYTVAGEVPARSNGANLTVAAARDVQFVDTLPAELAPLSAAGAVLGDGETTGDGGLWNATSRTLTWIIGDINRGTTVSRSYSAVVSATATPGSSVVNTAVANASSLPGSITAERTYAPLGTASATLGISGARPTISKSASPSRYGPGSDITFTVAATIPANSAYSNLTIWDQLPDGLANVAYVAAVCAPSCVAPATLPIVGPNAEGSRLGWYVGAVAAQPTSRTYTVTYRARIALSFVATGVASKYGDEFVNRVNMSWNNVDRIGAATPSLAALPAFDGTVSDSKSVFYDRPYIRIAKSSSRPARWDYQPGQKATFTVVLTNTGSQPATQLQFRDQTTGLAIDLASVQINGAPCGAGCALGAGILTTTLAAPIPAGGSATITYTAAPTTTGRLYNLATVPTYNDPFGTPYVDGLSASVTHLLPDPQLTLSKEVASSLRSLSGGVVASTSGTAVPFTFTIRNTSTTTAYAPTVTETPPTGFCIVAASATNGVTSPAANTWQLPGNLAPGAVFTFDANLVVCGDPTIGSQTNLATLTWNDAADGLSSNGTPYSTADTADFAVAAPTFKITKSPAIDAGATIQQDADPLDAAPSDGEWVIVVENTSDVSVGGVVVNDPMPATFEYRTGDATATWLTGTPHTISDTTNSAFPGGVLAGRRTGARIVINQLDPHQRVRISIPFVQNGAVPATGETTMVNTATLTNANWQAGEEITAQGEYTILPNETAVRVAKSVSTGGAGGSVPGVETVQATPSDQVKFTLDVTIEGDGLNVATHDIVVRDLLPDGMSLTNVPATGAVPSASGWTATCISGPCVAQYNGVFLGSRGAGSRTEVLWYLGDYTNTANSVYRITFTARVDATFANGMEVVDGFNDPLVNSARAWWNRAASRGGGANGNVYPLIPATMPIQSDLDMAGRRDNAAIDITTPHVELQKKVRVGGQVARDVDVGTTIDYTMDATNTGSAPAYNVTFTDDLGRDALTNTNRLTFNGGSMVVTPAGASCVASGTPLQLNCSYAGPLAGDPDGSGPLEGESIRVTYTATPRASADLISPLSPNLNGNDFIQNTARILSYNDVAAAGSGSVFTDGHTSIALHVVTPQPETEIRYFDVCPATVPVSTPVTLSIRIGNGDFYDPAVAEFDGDLRPSPYPADDRNGNGLLDSGVGRDAKLTVLVPAAMKFTAGSGAVRVVGPGPLATNQPYTVDFDWSQATTPFPDPDSTVANPDGSTTLVWNNLGTFPFSPNGAAGWHQPYYDLRVSGVTKSRTASTLTRSTLEFKDSNGSADRGSLSGELWPYVEIDDGSCPGGSPNHWVSKRPDASDGVQIEAGAKGYWTVTVQQDRPTLTNVRLVDTLPAGLTYAGTLPVGDSRLEVATISPIPAGWTSLQSQFTSAVLNPGTGETPIMWTPTLPLPTGTYTIRIPYVGDTPVLHPDQYVTNVFQLFADQGYRSDTGQVFTANPTKPSITKSVDKNIGIHGDTFTFDVDVRLPPGFSGKDVVVFDYINGKSVADPFAPGTTPFTSMSAGMERYPLQFDTHLGATCISGCDDTAVGSPTYDGLNPVGLPALPYIPPFGANTFPPGSSAGSTYRWYDTINNAVMLYVGDVNIDPQGNDRVIRFTYRVKSETYSDFMTMMSTRMSVPISTLVNTPNFWNRLRSELFTNTAILRSFPGNIAMFNTPPTPATASSYGSWYGPTNGGTNWDTANLDYFLQIPQVSHTKDCKAVDGDQRVKYTPVGTPNVECIITVRNLSSVPAYDVPITDNPRNTFDWGKLDPTVPYAVTSTYSGSIGAPAFLSGDLYRTTPAGTLPASWLFDLEGDETATLSYRLRIDPYSTMPSTGFNPSSNWMGRWQNFAVLSPWKDSPTGNLVGPTRTVTEQLYASKTYVNASKFPWSEEPVPSDSTDLRPFKYFGGPTWSGTQTIGGYPWSYRQPDGSRALQFPTQGDWANPLSGYWQGGGTITDLLQPPQRATGGTEGHPLSMMPQMTGAGSLFRATCAGFPANDISCLTPNGNASSEYLNTTDPNNWAARYLAKPTQPYTWSIDLRLDSMDQLSDVTVEDTLPFGWTYVAGSAEIVDGEWFLSWGDTRYRRDAAGNPTTATVSKTLASEVGVTPSYSRIPLRDATVTAGTASACAPATYSPNGPKVSWSFDQANPAMRELWDYRYMDGRKLYGIDETAPTDTSKNLPQGGLDSKNWVKIFFKAVPTASVMDCDPDDRSATPYLMQNNLRVSANTMFAGPTIVKDYAMAAPVDVPVSMEKTPDNESAADGSTSSYTVRVTNNLSVPLTNYTINDTLNISVPGGFTAPLSKGYTCGTAVFAGGTGGAEIACDTTSSPTTATMQYRFASIAPGETVTVTIPMTFVVGERNATVYTNNVSATVAEWNNVVLTDSGLIRVVTPTAPPLPAKTLQSGAEPAPVNFVNTDRISMAVAPWALHYDLLYVDTLPNGLAFVDYLAPTCAATCVTPVSQIQTLPPRSNPDGTTTIAWWFGDTNGGPSGASYSLPYRVRNKDAFVSGAKVPTGTALVNQVQGFSNQVNTVPPGPMATIPDPSPWLWPSAIRTLVHTMRDPNLSITKTAVPSAVPTGAPNSITYDVKITNAAHPNSVTAFNVRVLDTPNSALESIVPAAPIWIPGSAVVASVVDGWTAADPEMEYFIPSILAGQSVTFRYTAQVKDSFAADGVFQAVNSARIAEVRSYSRLQPLPGDRVLTDLPPVSTTTPLAAPRIDIDKWNGVGCVAETAVASIGTPVDWCIRVRNTGSAPAPVVNLVDVLPANWSFQAGSTTGTGWTAGPPTATSTGGAETLSWSLGTLAVGATAMISYRATPLPGSELDVTNVATATAFQSPGVPYPPASPGMVDTDDAKATLRTHALEISKTPDRQIRPFVPGGGDVTWTITVTNPSAVSSLSNLEVRDFLPEPLTFVSATSTDPRVGAAVSGATGSGPSSTTEVTVPVSGLGAGESVAITLVGHFSGSASWVDTWLTNDTSVIAREVSDAVANTAKVRFFEPAALGNYVWTDSNANGIQDASESGRDGVVVSLRDNVGNPLYRNSITGEVSTVSGSGWVALSMATGDDPATPATETGWYGFGDLPGGDYQVLFTRGPATVWTFLGQGTSSTDSDVDPATGVVPVTLAPGQTDLRIDGGLVPAAAPASIGDRVWLDSNGDGIQGLAELGVSGVVVRLMGPGADGLFETADDQVLATDTTDVAGSYLFDLLPPGTYQIAVDLPSGNSFTWSGQGSNSELDSDVNRVSGRTEPAVLAAGENRTDLDAGLIPRGINALGDYVWLDANIDGIQEPTETGIENLIVSLLSAGPDGVFETADDLLLDVTRTDSTGSWTFGELPDGIYQAQFAPDLTEPAQVNLQPTWVRQGSVGAIDSDGSRTSGRSLPVDLDSSGTDSLAVVNNDVDSGFFSAALPASLGDVVWLDANRNGLLDSGESGIGGIIVRLVDAAGVVRAITTTASDGTYLFSRLPAGDYTVQFALDPLVSAHALLVPTWEHTGSDDAIDSDIDRDVLETPTVSLSPGENDRTVDAGFFSEPSAINSLGDRTWLDSNFDGIQSSGEPGLGGVLVELLIAGSDGVFGTSDDLAIQSARTDAGGDYRFTRLPDGDYQVRFSLDAGNSAHDGLAATWQGQGGDQSTDSNANRVTGRSGVITLGSSNREDLTVDAGYISVPDPAALGDYTWVDVEADGIQSSGDTALGGVVVDLLGPGPDGNFGTADDAVLQSVETDSAGAYLVDELPPGDYRVRFVAAGFVSTWSNQGTDSDLDSNLDRGTGLTETITLNAGERDLSIDAGFLNASDAVNSVSDFVWLDLDADGVQDAAEVGVAGVGVVLFGAGADSVFGSADDVVLQRETTDASGGYLFGGLPDGLYQVGFELNPTNPSHANLVPTWALQGSDTAVDSNADRVSLRTAEVNLDSAGVSGAGVVDTSIDAGFIELVDPALLGDRVWLDLDADGVQDSGEPGVAGVRVELLGSAGQVLAVATSGSSGEYVFAGLPAGAYRVRFVLDSGNPSHVGLVPTWQDQGSSDGADSDISRVDLTSGVVTLAAGQSDRTVDAGFVQVADPASVGDRVWLDVNHDGVQSGSGEVGSAGVEVRLVGGGADAVFGTSDDVVLQVTTTDSLGAYGFTGLPVGEYRVQVVAPSGMVFTWMDLGSGPGAESEDSDVNRLSGTTASFTLSAGENRTDVDAGLWSDAPNSVGDVAWLDSDRDGVQDSTEPGVVGVNVSLVTPGPDGVFATVDDVTVDTTVTDSNGKYLFSNLADGNYQVVFALNAGLSAHDDLVFTWSLQVPGAGFDPNVDSDADRRTGRSAVVDLDVGSTNPAGVVVSSVDAGFFSTANPGLIGDRVWLDENADGIQSGAELGVSGINVSLVGPGADGVLGTTDDVVLWTVVTDASGNYEFNGLPAGSYAVRVDPGAGRLVTFAEQGSDRSTDSDIDRESLQSGVIELLADQSIRTIDIGLLNASDAVNSVSDFVWLDLDADGVQDAAEVGVAGVGVVLFGAGADSVFGSADDVVLQRETTDASGGYLFGGLPDGLYQVGFELNPTNPSHANLVPTWETVGNSVTDSDMIRASGRTGAIDLDATRAISTAVSRPDLDAGYLRVASPGSIGDRVWFDANGDGIQGPTESGVTGVKVELRLPGADGLVGTADDETIATVTTDAAGDYLFNDLPAGNYFIGVMPPVGRAFTWSGQGTNGTDSDVNRVSGLTGIVALAAGEHRTDIDAGLVDADRLGFVGDRVWLDTDRNGRQDSGESGIPGATVDLLGVGADGIIGTADDALLESTLSASGSGLQPQGAYLFENLPVGKYLVRISPPAGYRLSPRASSDATSATDSDIDPVTNLSARIEIEESAAGGVSGSTLEIDAGVYPVGGIGDRIWNDLDGDGRQDAGEVGVAGVKVLLVDASGATVGTTVTDSAGLWSFTGIPTGSYEVRVVLSSLPAGFIITGAANGCACGTDRDSDADPTSGIITGILVRSGEVNTTFDVGVRLAAPVLGLEKSWIKSSGTERPVWAIDVVNTGNDPAVLDIEVNDQLPTALRYTGFEGEGWNCAAEGQLVSCSHAGVGSGQAVPQLRIATDRVGDATGTITNVAFVLGSGAERTQTAAEAKADLEVPAADSPLIPTSLAFTGGSLRYVLLGLVMAATGATLVRRRKRIAQRASGE